MEFQVAVAEFTAKDPDIPIYMKNGNHEALYELLRSNQVDLVTRGALFQTNMSI